MTFREKDSQAVQKADQVIRSKGIFNLFKGFHLITTTEQFSQTIECGDYRRFLLHVFLDSTGAPTTIRVKVEFLNETTGKWHTYKQGLFAALFWEDTDVASGVGECFEGPVGGRAMRITLTGVGTSAAAYFTVDAAAEFVN